MLKKLIGCSLVLLLTACAGMSKVGPGEVTVRDSLAVRLDGSWNRFQAPGMGKVEVWTQDGLSLDTLRFFTAVPEGEPLAEIRGSNEKQVPKFRATMQPQEIVELFENLSVTGLNSGSTFHLDRLVPVKFLGGDGFRFDYSLTRKGDELEMKGAAFAAVRDQRLYMMVFQAPKIHYFGKWAAAAEVIAVTARKIN